MEQPINAADALQPFARRVRAEPGPLVESVRHVGLLAMTPAVPFRPFDAVAKALVQLGEDVADSDASRVADVDVPGVSTRRGRSDAEERDGRRG